MRKMEKLEFICIINNLFIACSLNICHDLMIKEFL